MLTAFDPIEIVHAKDASLISREGKRYLDGISSWWVNLHGHGHPHIIASIQSQAETLAHTLLADFTHLPAMSLAERLLDLLPGNMSRIFYSDNGSCAVETALKIALQYWHNENPNTTRTRIVSFKGSYFGETFGAMSAAGENAFNTPFWRHMFPIDQIDPPFFGNEESAYAQLKLILKNNQTACMIFEPLILGAGGMRPYSPQGLDQLIQLCKEHQVLTIADEVMTGFGRTGTLFASDVLTHTPDLMCLAKGLTGGTLPLAATACTAPLFERFVSTNPSHSLMHGHSYTGNPIACSAALASLRLLTNSICTEQRNRIAERHISFAHQFKGHRNLKRVETLGTILILEHNLQKPDLSRALLNQGILLRPLGNVLYVMPPYCITNDELTEIYEALISTLDLT
jgi:adenosylmethionine-8-amino-7-oxononanoate aminotransferase